MYVWKDESNKPLGGWPGQPMTKESDGTYYYDLPVTGTGTYKYIFHNNSGTQTSDSPEIPYEPGKEAVFNFNGMVSNTASGSSGSGDAVGHGSNSDGSYTLTIPGDAFYQHHDDPAESENHEDGQRGRFDAAGRRRVHPERTGDRELYGGHHR